MNQSYLRPICMTDPARAEDAEGLTLAGGWARFSHVECLRRDAPPRIVPVSALTKADLAPLLSDRPGFCGIDFTAPRLMGILNVTPDSFSDGGQHFDGEVALARARAMVAEGADVIDLGGESTRPGAAELPAEGEAARVVPLLRALAREGAGVPVSLDTRKSSVAAAGLQAGAAIVNDVSGLRFDRELAEVAAKAGAPLILMHSIGTPETMQAMAETTYTDVLLDVYDGLDRAIRTAEAAGVSRQKIMVDPGLGFGKTVDQNLALIRRVGLFHGLGCPVLLGASRKGMIGKIAGEPDAAQRGPGSAAIGLWAVSQGIQMLRVHDIRPHKQALALWQALARGG